LAESPVFARLKSRKGEARTPVIEVFRRYLKPMLLATGARLAENGLFYIFTTFSLTYVATQLKLDRNMALNGLLVQLKTVQSDVKSGSVPTSTVNSLNTASTAADNAC